MAKKNEALKRMTEDFLPTFPDDDIKCKDCEFRKPDLIENRKVVVKGYKNAYCKVYTKELKGKPNKILFENGDCKYYVKQIDD